MGLRRLTGEHLARSALLLVVLLIPLGFAGAWGLAKVTDSPTTIHGRVSEDGGWLPGTLQAIVGTPLRLRLVSDDVVHGFAVGKSDSTAIDLPPGKVVDTTLTFSEPGTYTFYCTRWCGPNHWRMRGVIEVTGGQPTAPAAPEPHYMTLGIDIDAGHPASVVPEVPPSAARGEVLGVEVPEGFRSRQDFIQRSPSEIWQALRRDLSTSGLTDASVWDLVAHLWWSTTSTEALSEGRALYARNCAACHGEGGGGDGVMSPPAVPSTAAGHDSTNHAATPADFTDRSTMLGASSALLQGKILRGGMGTGMPYWGPILTEAQMWALSDYLWTFQFEVPP
jgi:mono/diheme cytochrome c family protein/plastocyanin